MRGMGEGQRLEVVEIEFMIKYWEEEELGLTFSSVCERNIIWVGQMRGL